VAANQPYKCTDTDGGALQPEATAATTVPLPADAPVGMGGEVDDMHQQVDMLRAERDALNASFAHTRAVVRSQVLLLKQQNCNAASMAVAAAHQAGLLAQTGASGLAISVRKLLGQSSYQSMTPTHAMQRCGSKDWSSTWNCACHDPHQHTWIRWQVCV
jgi:hypothetical protein